MHWTYACIPDCYVGKDLGNPKHAHTLINTDEGSVQAMSLALVYHEFNWVCGQWRRPVQRNKDGLTLWRARHLLRTRGTRWNKVKKRGEKETFFRIIPHFLRRFLSLLLDLHLKKVKALIIIEHKQNNTDSWGSNTHPRGSISSVLASGAWVGSISNGFAWKKQNMWLHKAQATLCKLICKQSGDWMWGSRISHRP